MSPNSQYANWQYRLHEIIFEADIRAGKWFDIFLILAILLSVLVVMLDSVAVINRAHGRWLLTVEWAFTLLFTLEYLLRLICVKRPLKYATSFLGVVDLLAILPTYISLFVPGSQYLVVIRVLRVLRVFRVLKLVSYLGEASILTRAAQKKVTTQVCPECMAEGHDPDARFCKLCAAQLNVSPGEEVAG